MVMAFAGSMAYGEGERIDPGRADRTSEKTVDPGSRIWAEESGDFIHDRQYIIWEAEADDFFGSEHSGSGQRRMVTLSGKRRMVISDRKPFNQIAVVTTS
jgi:hypothetical protein